MTKPMNISLITGAALLFTACTGSILPVNAETSGFKSGSQDGCATASGNYRKNSNSFKNDINYKDGWFYGRKKCNPAQSK